MKSAVKLVLPPLKEALAIRNLKYWVLITKFVISQTFRYI